MESRTSPLQELPSNHQNAGHFRNYYLRNQALSNDKLNRSMEQKHRVPTISEITDFYLKKSNKFSSLKDLYEKTITTNRSEEQKELKKIEGELQKTYLYIMQKLLSQGTLISSKNSSANSSLNFNANALPLRQTQSLNVSGQQICHPGKIQCETTHRKTKSGHLIQSQKNKMEKAAQNIKTLKTNDKFKAITPLNSKDTFVECKKSMHQNLINISSNLSTMLQESCAGINDICQKVRLCLLDTGISYQLNKPKLETLDYQTAKKELNTLFEIVKSEEDENNTSEISVIIEEQEIIDEHDYEQDYEQEKKREIEEDLDKEPHKETVKDNSVEKTRCDKSITPFFTILKTESSKTRKETQKLNEFLRQSIKEIEKINNFDDFLNTMVEGVNNKIDKCCSKYPRAILNYNNKNKETSMENKEKKNKDVEKKTYTTEGNNNKTKNSQEPTFHNEDLNSDVDMAGNWSGTSTTRNEMIFQKTDFSTPDVYKKQAVTNLNKKLIKQMEANDSFVFFQKLMKNSPKNTAEGNKSRPKRHKSATSKHKNEKKRSLNDLLKKYEDSLWFRPTPKQSKRHTTKNVDILKTKTKNRWQNLLSHNWPAKSSSSLSQKSSKISLKQRKKNNKSQITLSRKSSRHTGASISSNSYNLQMKTEKPLTEADQYRVRWMRSKYAQMTKKNLRYMDILDEISSKDLIPLKAEYPRRNEEVNQKPNIKNSLLYKLIHNKNKNNDEAWSLLLANPKYNADNICNVESQMTDDDVNDDNDDGETNVGYSTAKKDKLQKLCTDLIKQVQTPNIENSPSGQKRKYQDEKGDIAKKLSKYIFSSDEDIIRCQSEKVYTVMPAQVFYNNSPSLHLRKNPEDSATMLPLQPMKEVKEGTLKRGEWSNDIKQGPKPMKVIYDAALKSAKKDERLSARQHIKSVLSGTQMKLKETNSWSPKNFLKYCTTATHISKKQIPRKNSPKISQKTSLALAAHGLTAKKYRKSLEVLEIFKKPPNALTGIKRAAPKTNLKTKEGTSSAEKFKRDPSPPSFMFDMNLVPKIESVEESKRELEKMVQDDTLARSKPECEKKIWERKFGKTTGQKLISFVENQSDKRDKMPLPKYAQPKTLTLSKPIQIKVAKQQAKLNELRSLRNKENSAQNDIEKAISVIEDKLVNILSKPTISNSIEAFDEMEKEILSILNSMKKNKKTIKHNVIKELPSKPKTIKPNANGQNDIEKVVSVIENKMVDILLNPDSSNSIKAFNTMEKEVTSALNSMKSETNKKVINITKQKLVEEEDKEEDDIADRLLKRLEQILETSSMSSLKNAKQKKSEKIPKQPKSGFTKRRTKENNRNNLPGSSSTSDEKIPTNAAHSPKKHSTGGTPVTSTTFDRSQKSLKQKTPKTFNEKDTKESNKHQNFEKMSKNTEEISTKSSENASMPNESVKSTRSIYQIPTALTEAIVNVAIIEQEQSSLHESPGGDQGSEKRSCEDIEQLFSSNVIGDQGDKIGKEEGHTEKEIEKEQNGKLLKKEECQATNINEDKVVTLVAEDNKNTALEELIQRNDVSHKPVEFVCSTSSEGIYGSPQWSPVTQNREINFVKEEIRKIKANEVVSEDEIDKIEKIQQEITDCIVNLEESIATNQQTVENTKIIQSDKRDSNNENPNSSWSRDIEKQYKPQTIKSQNILDDLDEVTEESTSSFYEHVQKIISTVENVYNQLEEYENEPEEHFTESQRSTSIKNLGSDKFYTSADQENKPTDMETFIENNKTSSNYKDTLNFNPKQEAPTIKFKKSPSFYNVLNFLDTLTDNKKSYKAIEVRTVRLTYFATICYYPTTLYQSCIQYIARFIPAPLCLLLRKPTKSCLKKTPSKDQGIRIIDFTKDKERVDRLRCSKLEKNENSLEEKDIKSKQVRVPRVSFHILQEEKSTQVTICPYHSANAMKILSKHQIELILDKPPKKKDKQVTTILNTVDDKSVDAILETYCDSTLANSDSILEQSENDNAILDSDTNTSNEATSDSAADIELSNYEEPQKFMIERQESNTSKLKHQSMGQKEPAEVGIKVFYDHFYVSSSGEKSQEDEFDKSNQKSKVEKSYDQVKEILLKDKDLPSFQKQISLENPKNQQDIQPVIVAEECKSSRLLNPLNSLSEVIDPNLLKEPIEKRQKSRILKIKSSTEELKRKRTTESVKATNLDSKCSSVTVISREEGLVKSIYVFVYLVMFTALNFDYTCF